MYCSVVRLSVVVVYVRTFTIHIRATANGVNKTVYPSTTLHSFARAILLEILKIANYGAHDSHE